MNIKEILEIYLKIYPTEIHQPLKKFLKTADSDLFRIDNSKGHITASSIVYCIKTNSLLLLEYKDFNSWYAPGGHRDMTDKSMLETAKRELAEETGLIDLEYINIFDNDEVPFDIDSHIIPKNHRWRMPKHYHHDFRYLFVIDKEKEIKIDNMESNNYKWIKITDLENNIDFQLIIKKIKMVLANIKVK